MNKDLLYVLELYANERLKLIRCLECKHYIDDICILFEGLCKVNSDDFCSKGERGDNDVQ